MIGILDLSMGNLTSVANAIDQCGYDVQTIRESTALDDLTHLVIPGVGSFATAMSHLEQQNLKTFVQEFAATKRPILGICLGMQLLATTGTEGGLCAGLNLIPGRVERFTGQNVRVPHIGWNTLHVEQAHPLFEGIKEDRDFYFVHSYYFAADSEKDVLACTQYERRFHAAIGHENIVGLQFHPEKSQKNGLLILENFCAWDGQC